MADFGSRRECRFKEEVVAKRWLSEGTFELTIRKPENFTHRPGQKILCEIDEHQREYSLVNGVGERDLVLCIRHIDSGLVSSKLSELERGGVVLFSEAYGFLVPRRGNSVLVATGTGIAPFVSYCRSGVQDFVLLHGVTKESELYYSEELSGAGSLYVPCLSRERHGVTSASNSNYANAFSGRVTDYLKSELAKGQYDFYLCGNPAMLKEAMSIIDEFFPGSKIFSESFF